MFEENKNLKDNQNSLSFNTSPLPLKDRQLSYSYGKTNKLITALFMVTDIMEKEEPLRNKLRTLGSNIVSDMSVLSFRNDAEVSNTVSLIIPKVHETMSFLSIASTVGMISEMNASILRKEFTELLKSLGIHTVEKEFSLEDFFMNTDEVLLEEKTPVIPKIEVQNFSSNNPNKGQMFKRHPIILPVKNSNKKSTRIGVQNSSNLLKAISDKMPNMHNSTNQYEDLKNKRRNEIIKILKDIKQGTIKDIKDRSGDVLKNCGEKTLQRELISMVADHVLKREGEKRWSHYFLAN